MSKIKWLAVAFAAFILIFFVLLTLVAISGGKTPNSVDTSSRATSTPSSVISGENTSFSLEEIQTHKDAKSCWAAVNNKVYDLTSWVSKHPGGPQKIIMICGTDATTAFSVQHGGNEAAEKELKSFLIGELK